MKFLFFGKKSNKKATRGINHVQALVKLANYHGKISPEQTHFIYSIGRKFRFTIDEIDNLIGSTTSQTEVPKSNFKGGKQVKNLIKLLDQIISPSNEQLMYFNQSCHDLGYDQSMVSDMKASLGLRPKVKSPNHNEKSVLRVA